MSDQAQPAIMPSTDFHNSCSLKSWTSDTSFFPPPHVHERATNMPAHCSLGPQIPTVVSLARSQVTDDLQSSSDIFSASTIPCTPHGTYYKNYSMDNGEPLKKSSNCLFEYLQTVALVTIKGKQKWKSLVALKSKRSVNLTQFYVQDFPNTCYLLESLQRGNRVHKQTCPLDRTSKLSSVFVPYGFVIFVLKALVLLNCTNSQLSQFSLHQKSLVGIVCKKCIKTKPF